MRTSSAQRAKECMRGAAVGGQRILEIRYHGPFVPSFLGMALWVEGSNVFKLRVPVRTYKAQYHVDNLNTMGFVTHSGKLQGGAGERAARARRIVAACSHARSSSRLDLRCVMDPPGYLSGS
jgi:hypothetical protein